MDAVAELTTIRADVLELAIEQSGPRSGWSVVLLHGFPFDVRCYDDLASDLARAGARVIVPILRGYGPVRFADPGTFRSGQQPALAHDLLALIDVLQLDRPLVAGFDWGGRAACLVAALWPDRVSGLVSIAGYNVQQLADALAPAEPAVGHTLWYQYYLHGDRGRAGLARYRAEFARTLWAEWSPRWSFTDQQFHRTSVAFDNPDFVDVVVHSYRHRYGLAAGDPRYQHTEDRIAAQPRIDVPTIVLDGSQDTVNRPLAASSTGSTSLDSSIIDTSMPAQHSSGTAHGLRRRR